MNWSVTNALALILENPLSLLERLHSIEDYQHSGKLSAERSFSKAKYELKGSVFLDYDDDKTGSSFQTVKLLQISQISKPTFRFFLIMNLWLAGNKSKKASRASLFLPLQLLATPVVAYSAHATFVSLQLVYPPRLPFNFLSVSLFLLPARLAKKQQQGFLKNDRQRSQHKS